MKEVSKVKAYIKKSISAIIYEKHILSKLNYKFIANLNFSFQDEEYLYLILDFFPGGDLRFYMNKGIIFSEIQIKFFISNLILSLNYIHNNNIIHRDVKPENLVFDGRGYLHLTDFGIARKIKNDKIITDKSGTPGYLAPEVLMKKPQHFSSDFFSVGVICYELLYGKKPFKGKNKKEIVEKVLYKNIKLKAKDLPEGFDKESKAFPDFINKLLKKNQIERLGYNNIEEIKNHPWFESIDWDVIENKDVDSQYMPFTPFVGDNFDSDFANRKDSMNLEHYDEFLKKINSAKLFKNFYFNSFSLNLTKSKSEPIREKTSLSNKHTTVTEINKNNISLNESGEYISDESLFENNNNFILMRGSSDNININKEKEKKNKNEKIIKKQLSG